MPYFPIPGENQDNKLFYMDQGKGDILFCIHSWYQNGRIAYTDFLTHFSEKYRVIVPDLPGHGESYKKIDGNYSLKNATLALVQFLKQLKKEKNSIHILGSSVGAFIALDIAIHYPDLVENVILISALVDFNASSEEINKMLKLDRPFLTLNLMYRAFLEKFPFDGRKNKFWRINGEAPGKWKHYRQVMENHPVFAARDYVESFLDASLKDEIKKNEKPTLVIYGEKDRLTPADFASSMASKMQRGILRIIEDAGHRLYIKKTRPVFHVIDEFLEEHRKRYLKWIKMFWRR